MILVDTNVIVDVLENDPQWADWSVGQLRTQAQVHALAINPIIYAELALTFEKAEALDEVVTSLGFEFKELPRSALFLAGKAFALYRQKGGKRPNVLSDFFIGAHAAVLRCAILTRDSKNYKSYFPSVKLISPR